MALSVDLSIKMIMDLWRQDTSATVTTDVAQKYFAKAVYHVERLDYRQNNIYTVTNDTVKFSTTPSDESFLLYVYKALEFMARAILSDDINNSQLGIAWRSGMESISTATAGKIKEGLYNSFKDQYKESLISIKLRGQASGRVDIYGTLNTRE